MISHVKSICRASCSSCLLGRRLSGGLYLVTVLAVIDPLADVGGQVRLALIGGPIEQELDPAPGTLARLASDAVGDFRGHGDGFGEPGLGYRFHGNLLHGLRPPGWGSRWPDGR